MAAYGRLAGQQGQVAKSLQDLAREAKESGELSKILGDLEKVTQDMQEVQSNLSQGNVNPEVMQKQDRILSRLLESQKSMRERDYEKRRTAETGTTVRRAGPAELDLGSQEGKDALREELYQVREGKYARDYEELIRKYFEQLEQAPPEGGKGEDPGGKK
jgi:Asp-tRNA(Asn)/Glu-tRNA(Gln) amidotransferase C subunit